MSTFQILHISDLHVNSKGDFDRSVVLDPLISRVKIDRQQSDLKPEIVVVSGDVACAGIKPEYESAKKFFDDLLKALELSQDKLFIVPGNHDVYRPKYRPSEIPSFGDMKALNDELENEEYRKDLFKGMDDYFNFIATNYPHLKSKHGRLVPFVTLYTAGCKKRIGLVGLNSAWMCRRSPDEREIAIGEYQVIKAMNELKETGETDLVIHVFHHPLTWLWPVDSKINKKYFNNSILLSGHLHDAEGGYYDDLDSSIYQFQAGGTYIGSESDWPNRFQYISFDWDKNKIRLNFRKFAKDKRNWCVEGEKGNDGTKEFVMIGTGKKAISKEPIHETETPLIIPPAYKNWISMRCKKMDIEKLVDTKDKELISLTMPEIFIPLYATPPGEKTRQKQKEREEGQAAVDIETLIAKNDYLLISGQAGSGKTTLLKYLAYTIANEQNKAGLNGFLPVLVFLRDLPQMKKEPANNISGTGLAEALLSDYFRAAGHGLTIELVKAYCKERRAIFLLTGLMKSSRNYGRLWLNHWLS